MPPSNAMENDKKRLRNQFTKDERTRLLAIMTEYGPLLDDKNISILSRKEIWEIIENKFNENGHSGRTSAQLKKYWQNYKYHSKRTKIIHKEVPKPLSPMTKHMVRMLAKVNPDEWAQYDVAVNSSLARKSPSSSKASPSNSNANLERGGDDSSSPMSKVAITPPKRSAKSDASFSKHESIVKRENSESNVVVSTTEAPGSSVTVSVICPEVPSSKSRTIFLKRNIAQGIYNKQNNNHNNGNVNENERFMMEGRNLTDRDSSPDFANNSDTFNPDFNESIKNYKRRLNVVGMIAQQKMDDSVNSREKEPSLELSKNLVGVMKEIRDQNLMEKSGEAAATNGRRGAFNGSRTSQDVDSGSGFVDMLQKLETAKESLNQREILDEIIKRIENKHSREGDLTEGRELDILKYAIANGENDFLATKDFLWLKLYLRLLERVAREDKRVAAGKFEPNLVSRINSTDKSNEENEETCSGESDQELERSDKRMKIDGQNDRGKLRVRRVSLTTQCNEEREDQFRAEIKVETEAESDAAQNSIHENAELDNRAMSSMNGIVEAKLQCARSELEHQIKLQKLEMEEKTLRVRIAEMTVQETRLRIQSLIEERRRATEIHELRLAQMAAEKSRSETEHAARLDASCVATAEGRARISSIERDRERSENFYQMQLRCMSAAGSSANVNCSLKCKQYQQ